MKKTLKLKPYVLPSIYFVAVMLLVVGIFFTTVKMTPNEQEEITYVSNAILGKTIPVISTDTKVIRPYTNQEVKLSKYFYDYQAEKERQESSLIYHENTYMQNSGVDFVLGEAFDVVAVLDGTVVNVKDDELLGKTVEIRHDNEMISVYQSLGEVTVKKDDMVKQGSIIGKTGTNNLDAKEGNHLHFELFIKGAVVDPEEYFDKTLNER